MCKGNVVIFSERLRVLGVYREFGADPELKSLYRAYALITLFGGFLWWIIPLIVVLTVWGELFALSVVLITLFPILVIFGFVLYWIPKFYSSIKYALEEDQIVVSKGVWWKTKSVVPYNRVTNINIYQGPISRRYGIGRLAIQTAGFSGANSSGYRTAEADFIGVKDFEGTKETVLGFVKGKKPVAVEAASESFSDVNRAILEELRRIREAVEK
jgi:membrane protein YdbS with pleckstrin-like domain